MPGGNILNKLLAAGLSMHDLLLPPGIKELRFLTSIPYHILSLFQTTKYQRY